MKKVFLSLLALVGVPAFAADSCILSTWTSNGPTLICNGKIREIGLSSNGLDVRNNLSDATLALSSLMSEGYKLESIDNNNGSPEYMLARTNDFSIKKTEVCLLATWTSDGPALFCNGQLKDIGLSSNGLDVQNNSSDATLAYNQLTNEGFHLVFVSRVDRPTYLFIKD